MYNHKPIEMTFADGYALGVIAMNPKSDSAERIKSRLEGSVREIADMLMHPKNSDNYAPNVRKAAMELSNWAQETMANNRARASLRNYNRA